MRLVYIGSPSRRGHKIVFATRLLPTALLQIIKLENVAARSWSNLMSLPRWRPDIHKTRPYMFLCLPPCPSRAACFHEVIFWSVMLGIASLAALGRKTYYVSHVPLRQGPFRILCPIGALGLPNLMPHRGLPQVGSDFVDFHKLLAALGLQ